LILSLDQIKNNQNMMQLIFAGGLGGCVGISLFETLFSDFFKKPIPMVGGSEGLGGDFTSEKTPSSIKIPLTLQSTQGSDLNLGSDSASANVPEQSTENVPESTENVPEQRNATPSPEPVYYGLL